MCIDCEKVGLSLSDVQLDRMKYLVDLNSRLWKAGSLEDHDAVTALADEGIREGIRPIDILFGIAGPMLVTVGEMWEKNVIDPAGEAKFTRAVETLIDVIARRIDVERHDTNFVNGRVLLTNVFGNVHAIGIQFVHIGLASLGVPATVLAPALEPTALVAKVIAENFQIVGLSIALPEQHEFLDKTLAAFQAATGTAIKIVVGGAAVSQKMIEANEYANVHFITSASFSENERHFWKLTK